MKYLKKFEELNIYGDGYTSTSTNGIENKRVVEDEYTCKDYMNINDQNYIFPADDFWDLPSDLPEKISGNFICRCNSITSLKFSPKYVGGRFECDYNKLTSLEFGPEYVDGDFDCYNNKITSLEFAPKFVGKDFNCSNNKLISLEFAPKFVGGDFDCYNNNIPEKEIDRYRSSGAVQGKIFSDYDKRR